MTSELDLIAYLTSKGVQVWRAAGSEITAHCFLGCVSNSQKGKGKLYLNTESWLYDCKRCGQRGNRKTLLEFFGDEDEIQHAGASDPMLIRRILSEAADMAHEMLLANEDKVEYLLGRGITGEMIVNRKLGYVPKNFGLSDSLPIRQELKGYEALIASGLVGVGGREWLNDALVIPYFSHGQVVQLRAKFIDGKYLTNAGGSVRLYNADALNGADQVLITEGEFDGMAVEGLIQQAPERTFPGLAVVSLAGVESWPDGFVESLSNMRKVFIGFDPDEAGRRGGAKLNAELGNRGRIVQLPTGEPKCDWSEWIRPKSPSNPWGGHTWQDLRDLLVESDLAGKQMFSIQDVSAKWTRRQNEAPGLKFGWQSIDTIMRPGLKPGQVFVPLAVTGTGKSVFLANLVHNMREKHGLVISLELTGAEYFEFLRRIHRFWFPKASREQMYENYSKIRFTEENRITKEGIRNIIRDYQDETGHSPDWVAVDYLQYFSRGFRGGSLHERATEAIMEAKAVAKAEDTALIIPSQVNRGAERGKPLSLDDARDSGAIEETADFVVSLFRPAQLLVSNEETGEALPDNGVFKVQMLKARGPGVGRVFDLRFSLMSLVLTDALFDRVNTARVDQELTLYRQGVHYDDYERQLIEQHSQEGLL